MLTGFNTDIKHGDRVFHVQTEDRGLHNPVVESLVYVGGEILLSKKSPYKDYIKGEEIDEKAVREMMDVQHRRIIEAIRRGRFDGKKPGDLMDPAPDEATTGPVVSPAAAAAAAAILSSKSGSFPAVKTGSVSPGTTPRQPTPAKPVVARAPGSHRTKSGAGINSPVERSLDQVIIDYLASEAASEHLELSLMASGELLSGDSVSLTVRAATSLTEKPVNGAHVSIRVVSTASPPQVLFRGVTGTDGLVKATVKLPEIGTGNGALIIAASSALGNNELKQLIKKKK